MTGLGVLKAATCETFDVERYRRDFPILSKKINGRPLVYLDNAASAQKPAVVIEAIKAFYENDYANVHRGVHTLSQRATDQYEGVREKVRAFINAADAKEIVFVRGTTEAVNLVAQTFGRANVSEGDEILITAMEHHSNIVPWQMLCQQTGAVLRVAPMSEQGELLMDAFADLLNERTKLVSVVHVSNALGTINPVKRIVELAHERNIPVLVDGAQSIPHLPVDVRELDCDFFAFSAHKLYGPSGIGVLYGKARYLQAMPPYQGGGDMIRQVRFEKSEYNAIPYKFEAGTPSIADTVGFGAALDYVRAVGVEAIGRHEQALLEYATGKAQKIPGLRIIGTAAEKGGILSFVLDRIHPHDIGTILDHLGIAIRAGHHCAMPIMDFYGVPATARASFGLYNTFDEVDQLMRGIEQVIEVFG